MTEEEFKNDKAKLTIHFAKIILIKIREVEDSKDKLSIYFESIETINYLAKLEYSEYINNKEVYKEVKQNIYNLL